jgi:synaptojanin
LVFSLLLIAPTPVLREMCKRYNEFVNPKKIRVAVGTYNVNGGKHFRSVVYKDVSLADWLLDSHQLARSKSTFYLNIFFLILFKKIVKL